MKKITALILLAALCLTAAAETFSRGDEIVINGSYALYDSYDRYQRKVLTAVPYGAVALYIAAVDRGICVAYGNYVGYLDDPAYRKVYSWSNNHFIMPGGTASSDPQNTWDTWDTGSAGQQVSDWNTNAKSYVPEFPYTAVECTAIQSVSTRSGPNTAYNEPGTFSRDLTYKLYYQTEGNGVSWGYFEFENNGKKYRLYSGMKRVTNTGYVPYDSENTVWAVITQTHTPHYGPGYDYAAAYCEVPENSRVKAIYQDNGWLLFEYEPVGSKKLRAWAPASCWQ